MSRLFDTTSRVRIRDVTLRDGLQSFASILPTNTKIEIYNALVSLGIKDLQITSFVNPSRVPQLADAEQLFSAVSERPERRNVLVANLKGFQRAVDAGARDIEAVVSVSETYNGKNAHRTIQKSLDEIQLMSESSVAAQVTLSIGLANCYHCVFEGRIDVDSVLSLLHKFVDWGIRAIGLSDTTGYATPEQVYEVSEKAIRMFPTVEFGSHLHDTRGRGLANAMAALAAGIKWFDASLAGLGGSPFAPGMGGNLSLESFVDCVSAMGIDTHIRPDEVFNVSTSVSQILRRSI